MARHNDFGAWGEEQAAAYLTKKGYTIVERDWHYGRSKADVDIIVRTPEDDCLAFVEVKTRDNEDLAEAEDAVTLQKMRRLGRAADHYIKMMAVTEELRFDVITIVGTESNFTIKHLEDAFNPLLI